MNMANDLKKRVNRMESKKLGVLGGMGPVATSVFFNKVIENTDAKADQDHIDMVILNHATLPDRTEAILEHNEQPFLEAVEKDLAIFDDAGICNIAIPCNTSHYFISQLQAMTSINIINMVDETAKYIQERYGENAKVAILATDGTISTQIYQKSLEHYNLVPHVPNDMEQEQIMRTIYNYKAGKPVQLSDLETIVDNYIYNEGCSCVVLGCTELSCIDINRMVSVHCVDAMQILIARSIQLSGKNVKQETIKS